MTAKIVRQHQVKEGVIFTQWDNSDFTVHNETNATKPIIIGKISYVKETDFEHYPQYQLFMEKIADNAWGYTYAQAKTRDLLPPLPPPVKKPKDYRKGKESANEDE